MRNECLEQIINMLVMMIVFDGRDCGVYNIESEKS